MKSVYKLFLLLFILTPFFPSFGSIDPIGTQWLYLSILNFFFFLHYLIFINKSFNLKVNYSLLSFFLFIVTSFLSFFYGLNTSEFFIEFSRLLILLFTIVVLSQIFTSLETNISTLYKGILFFLFLECLFFFSSLLLFFNLNGIVNLRGFTSNVNIQAFSIILKLPFILFYLRDSIKPVFKFLNFIVLSLSITILFLISSRASFLSLSIISLFFIFHQSKRIFSNFIYFIKFFIPGFVLTFFIINPLLNTGKKLANLSIIDSSSLTRLDFYKEAFFSFIDKPFSGVGLGNWKIFGIDAHKNLIDGYIVPYHAHNDFLQIAAETGIFSLVFYVLFFFFLFYIILNIQVPKNYISIKIGFFLIVLVYLIDANLNFPISRPLIQIQFLFFLSFIYTNYQNRSFIVLKFPKIFLLILTLLAGFSSYSSFKVYKSFSLQQYLLSDFKDQNYDTPLDIIEQINDEFPNITVTALPIKSLKANYYSNDSIINRLLDLSIHDNPYIKYPQALKSIRFKTNKQLDSSLYFAKDAFHGLPNNELHTATYLSILTTIGDSIAIDSLYDHIIKMNSYNMWNAYLLSNLELNRGKSEFVQNIFETANKLYPEDEVFKLYKIRYLVGDSIINIANKFSKLASKQFDIKDYNISAENYLKASSLIPQDPSYIENAAHAYYMLNNTNMALKLFDSVINHYDSRSGKAYYLKGLLVFETTRSVKNACSLFDLAIEKGNTDAEKAKNLICR